MRTIADLPIVTKIFALLASLAVVLVMAVGGLMWLLHDADRQYGDMIRKDMRIALEVLRIRGDLTNFGRQMNNVLLVQSPPTGVDALEASLSKLMDSVDRSVAIVRQLDDGDHAEILTTLTAALPRIRQSSAAAVAAKRAGAADHDAKTRAAWGSPDGRVLVAKLFDVSEEAANAEVDRVAEAAQAASERTRRLSVVVGAAIGLALLVFAILAYLTVTRAISRPIQRLASTMRRLAGQDFTAEVEGRERGDEVGGMAKAVQVFKENGLRTSVLEAEARQAREDAEQERAQADRERAAGAARQALVVQDLASGLAGLAAGDLTGRVKSFPDEYRKLEGDFNAAIETLQATIRTVAGNGQGIRSGSGELSKAADDLSKRTEQQAASLEETAAALDEITATVQKTVEGVKHAREVVSAARVDAEQSGHIVKDAVTAMSAIDRSSSEISNIIGVIDEIAFQTNLLALNAGVEAARAGESGKGFAVVASEVRALAQRSAAAAKEIKSLIDASSGQVKTGVDLVARAGTALTRIAQHVTEIDGIVVAVAASTQEQATALHQVNVAVNQMDQMTQQNAAMVEESTAASHSLAGEAEQLASLMAHFHVGEDTTAAPARRPHAPSRPAPASRPGARPLASVGNLALKPAPTEDWEEF